MGFKRWMNDEPRASSLVASWHAIPRPTQFAVSRLAVPGIDAASGEANVGEKKTSANTWEGQPRNMETVPARIARHSRARVLFNPTVSADMGRPPQTKMEPHTNHRGCSSQQLALPSASLFLLQRRTILSLLPFVARVEAARILWLDKFGLSLLDPGSLRELTVGPITVCRMLALLW